MGVTLHMLRSEFDRYCHYWWFGKLSDFRHTEGLGSFARDGAGCLPPLFQRPRGHGAGRRRRHVRSWKPTIMPKARGAKIYAELAGFGMSSDAKDITTPDVNGAARAVAQAIKDAGRFRHSEIDYINAHGTGTRANDQH